MGRIKICPYKFNKPILLHCFKKNFRGAGGSRTLVQTGKPYAFYMLIPDFVFRAAARPGPPTATLSPKISSCRRSFSLTISDLTAPPCRRASEQQPPGDVSSSHLVGG